MSLIERVKQHPIMAGIGIISTVAGAVVAVDNLFHLEWFNGALGKFAGWLTVDVTVPAWSLLSVPALASLATIHILHQHSALVTVTVERDSLKRPVSAALGDMEMRVLSTISILQEEREYPDVDMIRQVTKCSLLEVSSALDVLRGRKFVSLHHFAVGEDWYELEAEGRKYLTSPEVYARYRKYATPTDG
ncbi:hypothetical protein PSH28_02850 [Pseudomonas resinovorans]|uniref:hypothetical protein n=1 Tax=Metapseudomonas resinovorans TaxID=53412 RepID=UPI00237FA64C|nr:hypothetical protein [Pseudomonas resinovorans]MDE3735532.1 hypothetical protein [Pseudomonas resinovorans]